MLVLPMMDQTRHYCILPSTLSLYLLKTHRDKDGYIAWGYSTHLLKSLSPMCPSTIHKQHVGASFHGHIYASLLFIFGRITMIPLWWERLIDCCPQAFLNFCFFSRILHLSLPLPTCWGLSYLDLSKLWITSYTQVIDFMTWSFFWFIIYYLQ